jgi:hypothetical protein
LPETVVCEGNAACTENEESIKYYTRATSDGRKIIRPHGSVERHRIRRNRGQHIRYSSARSSPAIFCIAFDTQHELTNLKIIADLSAADKSNGIVPKGSSRRDSCQVGRDAKLGTRGDRGIEIGAFIVGACNYADIEARP